MKMTFKLLSAAVLTSAFLAGCGGGGGDAPVAQTPSNSVNALVAFVQDLIATSTNETGEPIDINSRTFAADDTAEPSAI
jgi:outer membrane murein-binding lipoprotein Lpp